MQNAVKETADDRCHHRSHRSGHGWQQLLCDSNGNPQMGHVTGAGCQLSGILTAFLAANPENKLQAAAAAVCMMGYAGELAAEKSGQSGSGTYRVSLMDAVSCMDGDILERGARYEIR